MSTSLIAAALALALAAPLAAQQPVAAPSAPAAIAAPAPPALSAPLTVDPKVRVGRLPNGIRYYVRQNSLPAKRAELRLVVNAGSVLEGEDQRGYAHFVEHTAFNGTTHFAKNELVSYLQSIGVRFGADLNAYTGFDETVYILPVPTDTARLVDKAFQILGDWARGQLFDSAEVVNERGVVHEEWRGRRGANDRVLQQWLPVALKGSIYAQRLPIGTEQSIMAATPRILRRFYDEWYRPNLMAVVAVGDFEPASMEAKIRKQFSGIRPVAGAKPRPVIRVPDNKEPLIAIATDKELTSSQVAVVYKQPKEETRTVADYRRDLIADLYTSMLNARFNEIAQKPDAPFLGAGASKSGFVARTMGGFTLSAGVKEGGIERGLEAVLTETRRVDQYGYLPAELEREKQDLLRGYERANAEREKTVSAAFVQEYIGNYLRAEPIPGIVKEYALVQQLLPTISLADVNASARAWITDENRIVIAATPQKDGVKVPTATELQAVFANVGRSTVAAYAETISSSPLLEKPPAPGRIVSQRVLPGVGIAEWTLSNGARVLVKPTDFKADEIQLSAYAEGGTSLASDANYMSASLASQIVALSGVGSFNRVDLNKKLSGKVARLNPNLDETAAALSGNASPKDLVTLLQLTYLQFTAPRLDTLAWQAFKNQVGPFLTNRSSDPRSVFGDTIQVTMSQHHSRQRPWTMALFAEINPDSALAFYRARFADAGRFTFVFVGNVDTTSLKPLVEQYIASLPGTGVKEQWKDVGIRPPSGLVERTVRKGVEPQATTQILFSGPFEYSPANRFTLRALTDYLQIKLVETLREKLGGTYSPNISGSGMRAPRQEYRISVGYTSAPEKVDTLTRTTLALIDSVKRTAPSQADVDRVKAQILRSHEVELRQNAYWMGNILARDRAGEDLSGFLSAYDDMVRALTPKQIQDAARKYFDTGNYARFILLPEAGPVPKA
ncbi:MAG: insulinase family protein [Gemmatimonadaceae bacterium]